MNKRKIHCLKTWPNYYRAICDGEKIFEIRKNDRNFTVGDILVLQEFDNEKNVYTGAMIAQVITYIADCPDGLRDGYVCMGLRDPRE